MAKLATLTDDFEDGVIDPSLWSASAGVTESLGACIITPWTTTRIIQSINFYDATESRVIVHIPIVTANGTTGTLLTGVGLRADANNAVAIVKESTDFICQKQVAGTYAEVYRTPYNASAMAYWRFRETSGIFYWDTSADGSTWTNRFNTTVATNLFPLTNVIFLAYASFTGTEPFPGNAQIYDINLGLQMHASGASTSDGSATLTIRPQTTITASGASTSDGSANIQIHAAGVETITASAASLSAGTAMIFTLAPGQLTATGQSFSAGSATLRVNFIMTAMGSASATGTAHLDIIPTTVLSSQYYLFEPPVALDNPPTLPPPFPRYRNSFARWQGGQRRGRTVLRTGSSYITTDSPTVDQCNAADSVYLGGHVYTVTQAEANSLSAHGYSVTPILTDITAPVLNILAPHAMVNVDQIVRVLLTTSEPSALTGTLSTGDTVYPISVPSTAFSIDISELPDAVYRISITATDIAGNHTIDYVDINIIHDPPLGPCLYPSDSLFPGDSLYPILCRLAHPFPALTIYPSESLTP